MKDVFVFRWQVHTGGYRWVQARREPALEQKPEGRFLTAITPPFTARTYVPLQEHPALFRVCVDTPLTEEGILAFATQYGWLGDPVAESVRLPDNRLVPGEGLPAWQTELTALKRAVTLWDLVQKGDTEGLARYIVWTGTRVVAYHDTAEEEGGYFTLIASVERHPDILARFPPGDVGQPALYQVQRMVNKHLEGRVASRLLWNKEWSKLDLYIYPHSLIGALWLQFARAIAGDKHYHQCEACGTWIEISLEHSRPTRLYCSNACRFKVYRKRQDDAYRLHTEKVPLKEIAKRLGTDTATAKGWIEKGKAK